LSLTRPLQLRSAAWQPLDFSVWYWYVEKGLGSAGKPSIDSIELQSIKVWSELETAKRTRRLDVWVCEKRPSPEGLSMCVCVGEPPPTLRSHSWVRPHTSWSRHQSAPFVRELVSTSPAHAVTLTLLHAPIPAPLTQHPTLPVRPHDPTPHTSRPGREAGRGVGGVGGVKCREVSTFGGDEVERPQLLWERRARRSEQPAKQEEGRGHGRHSNTTAESVGIKKKTRTEKEKREWVAERGRGVRQMNIQRDRGTLTHPVSDWLADWLTYWRTDFLDWSSVFIIPQHLYLYALTWGERNSSSERGNRPSTEGDVSGQLWKQPDRWGPPWPHQTHHLWHIWEECEGGKGATSWAKQWALCVLWMNRKSVSGVSEGLITPRTWNVIQDMREAKRGGEVVVYFNSSFARATNHLSELNRWCFSSGGTEAHAGSHIGSIWKYKWYPNEVTLHDASRAHVLIPPPRIKAPISTSATNLSRQPLVCVCVCVCSGIQCASTCYCVELWLMCNYLTMFPLSIRAWRWFVKSPRNFTNT